MCEICRQFPCHPCCPNFEDKPVTYCGCGRPIYAGDDFYEILDVIYCEECVSDCRRTADRNDFEEGSYYAEL